MSRSSAPYALVGLVLVAPFTLTVQAQSAQSLLLLTTLSGHSGYVSSAEFSPDGTRIVTASSDGTAKVWDAVNGQILRTLSGHSGYVLSAKFSPDGTRIITASSDGTAKVWDASSGQLIRTLSGHTSYVHSAAFSPDGQRIVTASTDKTAKVWDVSGGGLLFTFIGNSAEVFSAAFSPDGKRIVTAGNDFNAKVWDASSKQLIRTLEDHTGTVIGTVKSAAFSPDGTRIVTAMPDTAQVWDTLSGELLTTLRGHSRWVNSAKFSPDGTRIVTASSDGTAKVWDTSSGELIRTLSGLGGMAAFSPDGQRIVTTNEDQTAKVWDASSLFVGTLFIDSAPSGAQVVQDGKVLGKTPLTLKDFPPGPVNYTVTLEGYASASLQGVMLTSEPLTLNATLHRFQFRLILSSTVPTAHLFVAGQDRGPIVAGQVLTFSTPEPDLELRAEGYASQPLKLTLIDGKTLRQTVKLERQGGVPLLGSLSLSSNPNGAQVLGDGKVLGKTPLTLKDLPSGPVNYTLALEGYGEVVLRGEVKAGQSTNLKATLERIPAVPPVVPPTPPTPVAPVVPTAPSAPTPPAAPVVKPQLTLLGPVNGSSVTGTSLTLKLQLSDYSGPPPLLSYSVNGQSSRSVGVRSSGASGLDLSVDLPKDLQDNQRLELLIRAQDPSFALEPLRVNYTYRKPVKRWALVVGNAQYTKIRPLANPTNDATDMAALLTKLGFDVTLEQNLGKSQLEEAIDTFGQKLQKEPGVALFYYSGHGLEVNGINYLVPVDAAFKGASEVPYKAVNVGLVLAQMQDSQNPTNLLILDSCRDNPLPDRSTKSLNSSGGFAFLNAPRGTVIAYATAPGTTADDGQGRNSPYTASLLSNLITPGRSISQVFNRVRADVIRSTGGKQQPWESVSLLDDLFLNP